MLPIVELASSPLRMFETPHPHVRRLEMTTSSMKPTLRANRRIGQVTVANPTGGRLDLHAPDVIAIRNDEVIVFHGEWLRNTKAERSSSVQEGGLTHLSEVNIPTSRFRGAGRPPRIVLGHKEGAGGRPAPTFSLSVKIEKARPLRLRLFSLYIYRISISRHQM